MAPKRENHEIDIELARVAREVRDRDDKPRIFDPATTLFRGAQVLFALGAVYGFGGAVQNYNHRLAQAEARMDQQRLEINGLKRRVVYTGEWRAWREVFQLVNKGQIVVPDPKDYTTDRTE